MIHFHPQPHILGPNKRRAHEWCRIQIRFGMQRFTSHEEFGAPRSSPLRLRPLPWTPRRTPVDDRSGGRVDRNESAYFTTPEQASVLTSRRLAATTPLAFHDRMALLNPGSATVLDLHDVTDRPPPPTRLVLPLSPPTARVQEDDGLTSFISATPRGPPRSEWIASTSSEQVAGRPQDGPGRASSSSLAGAAAVAPGGDGFMPALLQQLGVLQRTYQHLGVTTTSVAERRSPPGKQRRHTPAPVSLPRTSDWHTLPSTFTSQLASQDNNGANSQWRERLDRLHQRRSPLRSPSRPPSVVYACVRNAPLVVVAALSPSRERRPHSRGVAARSPPPASPTFDPSPRLDEMWTSERDRRDDDSDLMRRTSPLSTGPRRVRLVSSEPIRRLFDYLCLNPDVHVLYWGPRPLALGLTPDEAGMPSLASSLMARQDRNSDNDGVEGYPVSMATGAVEVQLSVGYRLEEAEDAARTVLELEQQQRFLDAIAHPWADGGFVVAIRYEPADVLTAVRQALVVVRTATAKETVVESSISATAAPSSAAAKKKPDPKKFLKAGQRIPIALRGAVKVSTTAAPKSTTGTVKEEEDGATLTVVDDLPALLVLGADAKDDPHGRIRITTAPSPMAAGSQPDSVEPRAIKYTVTARRSRRRRRFFRQGRDAPTTGHRSRFSTGGSRLGGGGSVLTTMDDGVGDIADSRAVDAADDDIVVVVERREQEAAPSEASTTVRRRESLHNDALNSQASSFLPGRLQDAASIVDSRPIVYLGAALDARAHPASSLLDNEAADARHPTLDQARQKLGAATVARFALIFPFRVRSHGVGDVSHSEPFHTLTNEVDDASCRRFLTGHRDARLSWTNDDADDNVLRRRQLFTAPPLRRIDYPARLLAALLQTEVEAAGAKDSHFKPHPRFAAGLPFGIDDPIPVAVDQALRAQSRTAPSALGDVVLDERDHTNALPVVVLLAPTADPKTETVHGETPRGAAGHPSAVWPRWDIVDVCALLPDDNREEEGRRDAMMTPATAPAGQAADRPSSVVRVRSLWARLSHMAPGFAPIEPVVGATAPPFIYGLQTRHQLIREEDQKGFLLLAESLLLLSKDGTARGANKRPPQADLFGIWEGSTFAMRDRDLSTTREGKVQRVISMLQCDGTLIQSVAQATVDHPLMVRIATIGDCVQHIRGAAWLKANGDRPPRVGPTAQCAKDTFFPLASSRFMDPRLVAASVSVLGDRIQMPTEQATGGSAFVAHDANPHIDQNDGQQESTWVGRHERPKLARSELASSTPQQDKDDHVTPPLRTVTDWFRLLRASSASLVDVLPLLGLAHHGPDLFAVAAATGPPESVAQLEAQLLMLAACRYPADAEASSMPPWRSAPPYALHPHDESDEPPRHLRRMLDTMAHRFAAASRGTQLASPPPTTTSATRWMPGDASMVL